MYVGKLGNTCNVEETPTMSSVVLVVIIFLHPQQNNTLSMSTLYHFISLITFSYQISLHVSWVVLQLLLLLLLLLTWALLLVPDYLHLRVRVQKQNNQYNCSLFQFFAEVANPWERSCYEVVATEIIICTFVTSCFLLLLPWKYYVLLVIYPTHQLLVELDHHPCTLRRLQ